MLHSGAATEPAHGFIGIEFAEQKRREQTVATFRARHDSAYVRMVQAALAMKAAHQEFEAARVAAAILAHGLPMSDLLDAVESDARAALLRMATDAKAKAEAEAMPAVAQVQQMGDAANAQPEATKKKAS
jgi:hypothetical protein